MADFLRQKANITPRLDSGGRIGELTVWVGEKRVARKGFLKFPDKKDVLAAVLQQLK